MVGVFKVYSTLMYIYMLENGCILVLSCSKEKYEKERFKQWGSSIKFLAESVQIFYLFGKSTRKPIIPEHRNTHVIIAECGDNYEDIPLKMYYGYQFLRNFNFDFIIKIDETINITDYNIFYNTVRKEISDCDYLGMVRVIGNEDFNKTTFCMWHQNRTYDKRFFFTPSIIFEIPFAGGPAYAINSRALKLLSKEYFIASLYEDYALGYNLYNKGIRARSSSLIGTSIILDDVADDSDGFPRVTVYMNTKHFMDTHIHNHSIKRYDCSVDVMGGLGNQLFQIAAALSYAIDHDMNLTLIPRRSLRNDFYWDTMLKSFSHLVGSVESETKYIEKSFSYNIIPYEGKDIHLQGYFQSYKYINSIRKIFRNKLHFSETIQENIKKYNITKNHVIVHARRGDYVKFHDTYTCIDETYYINAFEEICKYIDSPRFILISDDKEFWSSTSFSSREDCIIVNEDELTTFYLMMNSHNFIIANSTFSWWGAYLSDAKYVIAPKKWFGAKGPQDWADIYDPAWKLL
jgi:hypothetical protein